jgi:uncharacterized integral membrane protein
VPEPTATPSRRRPDDRAPAARAARGRTLAAAILGGLLVVFAFLNLDEVKVNWIATTSQTPLILVIGVVFVLGMGAGVLLQRRRTKKARR